MTINARDIRLVAFSELRQLFRSAQGVLALCFLLLPLIWLLARLSENAEMINNLATGNMTQQEMFLLEAVKWFTDSGDELLSRVFVDHSPFLTILFVMTAFGMPFLTMIAALDQNAGDIGSKGIRFFLPRTSRDNLLLGRFVGTMLFWSICLAAAGLVGTVTALFLDTSHSVPIVLLDGVWFTAGLILVALPFVAFMGFCATSTGSPLLSVTMGVGIYLGVFLAGGLGGWFHEGLKAIRYAFPAPLRYDLMLGSAGEMALSTAAMVGYAVVYLVLAGWIIRKRDL